MRRIKDAHDEERMRATLLAAFVVVTELHDQPKEGRKEWLKARIEELSWDEEMQIVVALFVVDALKTATQASKESEEEAEPGVDQAKFRAVMAAADSTLSRTTEFIKRADEELAWATQASKESEE